MLYYIRFSELQHKNAGHTWYFYNKQYFQWSKTTKFYSYWFEENGYLREERLWS
jgi:hypothetical protein